MAKVDGTLEIRLSAEAEKILHRLENAAETMRSALEEMGSAFRAATESDLTEHAAFIIATGHDTEEKYMSSNAMNYTGHTYGWVYSADNADRFPSMQDARDGITEIGLEDSCRVKIHNFLWAEGESGDE